MARMVEYAMRRVEAEVRETDPDDMPGGSGHTWVYWDAVLGGGGMRAYLRLMPPCTDMEALGFPHGASLAAEGTFGSAGEAVDLAARVDRFVVASFPALGPVAPAGVPG